MNKADEKRYTQDQVDLALMAGDLKSVKLRVEEIDKKLDASYVTKEELKLVQLQLEILQRIVYGVVGLIITSVVGGGLMFLINTPK